MPMGLRLNFLMANGKTLAGAGTVEQCQSMAARHAVKGKL